MGKRIGVFIDKVIIHRIEFDHDLNNKICLKQNLDREYVESVLRYNVIPIRALAKISGTTINNIHQKLKPQQKNNGELTYALNSCYPFYDLHEKFVFRNPKCEMYIHKMNGYVKREESLSQSEPDEIREAD